MAKVNYSGLYDHNDGTGRPPLQVASLKRTIQRALRNRVGARLIQAQVDALNGHAVGDEDVVVTRTRIAARQENINPSNGNIPIETITIVDRASTAADQAEVEDTIVNTSPEVPYVNNNPVDGRAKS